MKVFKFSITIMILLSLVKCNFSGNETNTLPVVNINDADKNEIPLSLLVSDFKVIPLETNHDNLIKRAFTTITNNSVYVGTQTDVPSPARLFQFDMSGNFIREIGKAGSGPGEHTGYVPGKVRYFEDKNKIIVTWDPGSDKPQVFDGNGKYVGNLDIPRNIANKVEKIEDGVWFYTGQIAGRPLTKEDSTLVTFINDYGEIISSIPRDNYPTSSNGYSPTGTISSYYSNGSWRILRADNDTLFRISNNTLIPEAIFYTGSNRVPYNEVIAPTSLSGKYYLKALTESDRNWILIQSVIDELDVMYSEKYGWIQRGGKTTYNLVIIDKTNNKVKMAINIVDDIFGIFSSNELMGMNWSQRPVTLSISSFELKQRLDGVETANLSSAAKKALQQLANLNENDNPVLFLFDPKNVEIN